MYLNAWDEQINGNYCYTGGSYFATIYLDSNLMWKYVVDGIHSEACYDAEIAARSCYERYGE